MGPNGIQPGWDLQRFPFCFPRLANTQRPPLLLRLLRLPERANLKGDETEVLGFTGRALALALMSTVTLAHYREQFVRLTSCSNYSNPLFFFFFFVIQIITRYVCNISTMQMFRRIPCSQTSHEQSVSLNCKLHLFPPPFLPPSLCSFDRTIFQHAHQCCSGLLTLVVPL